MTLFLLLMTLCFQVTFADNCSSAKSCSECLSVDVLGKTCYWCRSLVTDTRRSGCLRFKTDEIANLLCPEQWVHMMDMCPVDNGVDDLDLKVHDVLTQIERNDGRNMLTSSSSGNLDPAGLKDLLHKLLILKLLRKMKDKNTVLTEEEESLLHRLTSKNADVTKTLLTTQPPPPTTTTATTTTTKAVQPFQHLTKTQQLAEILRLLQAEAARRLKSKSEDYTDEKIKNELEHLVHKISQENAQVMQATHVPAQLQDLLPTTKEVKPSNKQNINAAPRNQVNPTRKSLNPYTSDATVAGQNRVEAVDVKYEESNEENLSDMVRKQKRQPPTTVAAPTHEHTTVTRKSVKINRNVYNCQLLDEDDSCNSDHNCTWCNTLDTCIHRNKEDYTTCVRHAEQLVDKEYGLDRCFKSKGCKECVMDDKCYWCETSQRCHTYPFFGYVPNSCGGDWYVKQCDVQLAVIIVILPLIIILLGMVTFYFCLKYCHYRHKVLRVPLFDKPGIFDYRKDKKVYFVNPEDESSDEELQEEKMRKKYRLPVEKAPLIDPNT